MSTGRTGPTTRSDAPASGRRRAAQDETALDEPLGLEQGVTADRLRTSAKGHQLATGTLVGVFAR
ncbi:hypothetical protein BJF90_35610 [Pseudonocardia sp. CNS-004]|nr:hypothetical protein BJF90_35610 [Pseudonocardia sp. CNS-004]